MAKKFIFNKVTLEFEEFKRSPWGKVRRISLLTSLVSFSAFLLYIVFSSVYYSPKELMMKRENKILKNQYTILNRKVKYISSVLKDLEDKDNEIYRTIFEAEPIPKSVTESGVGGVNRYSEIEGYNNSDLIIEATKKIDLLSKQLYVQSKSLDQVSNMALKKEVMLSSIPAIQPVRNKDLKRVASGFGMRIDPHYKVRKMHEGMDFSAPTGTPIYSTGDGVITRADRKSRGFGNHVRVNHGFGYLTLYAHMSKVLVKVGQKVTRGDVIGLVGNTGKSKGPHCHYEVRKNGSPINPVNYYFNDLTPEEYSEMIKLAERPQQSLD